MLHRHTVHTRKRGHPAVLFLMDTVLHRAFVPGGRLLCLQAPAIGAHAALGIVHSLLERVVFPAKYVVAMLAVPSVVACAQDEGLRSIGRPIGFVVKFAGIPDDLQMD